MLRFLPMVLVLGCGATEMPAVGGSCSSTDDEPCLDGSTRLICLDGKWAAYACDGTLVDWRTGTSTTGACEVGRSWRCIPRQPVESEACPIEGKLGRCMDTTAISRCVAGKWLRCPCKATYQCSERMETQAPPLGPISQCGSIEPTYPCVQ